MHIDLRKAKKRDLALVRKLTAETGWKDIPESQKKLLNRKKWNKHMNEVFESALRKKNSQIFIAKDELRRFIGYLFVGENRNYMTELNLGFIYDIFVKEEFRGKGIGKKLLDKADEYCRENGYYRIGLEVSTANESAINLYNKAGFKSERMYMAKEL